MITPELVACEQAKTYIAHRERDRFQGLAEELRHQVDLLVADNLALRQDIRDLRRRTQQLEKNNRRSLNAKDAQLSKARRAASLADRRASVRPPASGAYGKR